MELKIGHTYKNGYAKKRTVMGPTSYNPAFVWTLQGEHFRQIDGRYIYDGTPRHIATPHDLVEEMED